MSHDARELPEFTAFRKPQVQQGTAAGMLAPPPDCPVSLTRSTARGAPMWLLLLSFPGETLVRAALSLEEGHLSPPAPVAGAVPLLWLRHLWPGDSRPDPAGSPVFPLGTAQGPTPKTSGEDVVMGCRFFLWPLSPGILSHLPALTKLSTFLRNSCFSLSSSMGTFPFVSLLEARSLTSVSSAL